MSTSSSIIRLEGIKKVFERADKYVRNLGTDTPTIVFDEIGLAELSPHNPLKILHPYLERPESKIAFLGMSNWTLDLSKMNRLIYVARADLELDDLMSIFDKSTEQLSELEGASELKRLLAVLAKTYYHFREWQKACCSHRTFHGSRDMYAVSKFVYHRVRDRKLQRGALSSVIKQAIERNFGGAVYHFSQQKLSSPRTIDIATVPELSKERLMFGVELIRARDFASRESLESISRATQADACMTLLDSSAVFKRFFLQFFS